MSSVSSPYSSNSRVTGMYSNYDTDTLVKNMCSSQQSKIDKQKQKVSTYTWYDEAVESVTDAVKEFSDTYCSVLGSSSMLKSATYCAYTTETTSTSKAVTLTASDSASVGDISVMVTQLAVQSNVTSTGKVSKSGSGISTSNTATLAELSFANKLIFDSAGKISFSINGKSFSFKSDTKLQTMLNTINNDTDANVTMKYSRLSDKFTIEADSGGIDSKVSITNSSGNAFGTSSAFQIDNGLVKIGKNALAKINGTSVSEASNEFEYDGITYKLNKVTEGTTEEYIDFTVERDFSSTVDAITKFVDAFNDLVTKLDLQVNAKDYSRDFAPLTDAQKEDMTEKEIEAWEIKAKNGILHNDQYLEKFLSGIKNSFFSSAGGTGKSAAAIGISSASYFSSDKGKIVLDKTALTAALEENPEEVLSIFTGGDSKSASSEQGVVYKIKSSINTYMKNADNSVDNNKLKIDDIEDGVDDLEDKLDDMAERYYAKFSAMETALANLNSQSSYVSQMFA